MNAEELRWKAKIRDILDVMDYANMEHCVNELYSLMESFAEQHPSDVEKDPPEFDPEDREH